MQRIGKQFFGGAFFYDLPQVHDGNLVGNVFDHRHVVGDEHIGQPHLFLQILQKVQDLRLDGNIQRRDRLITDNELRVHRQGAGNADALAAATVQFVRVTVFQPLRQADQFHQFIYALVDCLLALYDAGDFQRFGNQLGDAHAGIQRGVRILEDHLDLVAVAAELSAGQRHNVGAVKQDLPAGGLLQFHDQLSQRGLATTGLAHDAQGRAFFNLQVDIVHRMQFSVGDIKVFFQVFGFQQCAHRAASFPVQKHLTQCPGSTSTICGSSWEQRGTLRLHRSQKLQCCGRLVGSIIRPGIGFNRLTSLSRLGMDSIRPMV